MKYHKGQIVKIRTDADKSGSWSVISAMRSYPDGIFTIECDSVNYGFGMKIEKPIDELDVYYTIVTEPKTKDAGYRYDIKEDYLISLEEIRDYKINKILENGEIS